MYINNLTTNTAYEMRVRAATQSHIGQKRILEGEWSATKAVLIQPGCENIQQFVPAKAEDQIILVNIEEHLGMLAGIICGTLGLLSLIFSILLCRLVAIKRVYLIRNNFRKCRQGKFLSKQNEKYYSGSPALAKSDVEISGWDSGKNESNLHAIPVQIFPKHVIDLHMNHAVGFAKEYEEIRAASCLDELAAQESQNFDSQERNRYPNIAACK